jgi:hypothetical protein
LPIKTIIKADSIVNQAIEAHGGDLYKKPIIHLL